MAQVIEFNIYFGEEDDWLITMPLFTNSNFDNSHFMLSNLQLPTNFSNYQDVIGNCWNL